MKNRATQSDCQHERSERKVHWGWATALCLLVIVSVAVRYALPVRDGDIWFHLLYGEYFWQHKTLIADHTIFSWTPASNETIYCTWLADLFLYSYYKITGITGLYVLRYFCIYMLVFSCFLFARKLKIAGHPLTWLLCLLSVFMAYTGIIAKPEIFSFLFMILLAWNWWYIREGGSQAWKNCYLIPLIMLFWVNSHGGFVFGVVFVACTALGELLNTWLRPGNMLTSAKRKHLLVALFFTVISLLLTPYGYSYLLQLVRDLLPTRDNLQGISSVASYISPFRYGQEDQFSLVLLANINIIVLFCLFIRFFRKLEWSSLLSNLLFAYLYTRFYRTTFYWAPVFLFSSLSLLASGSLFPSKWKGWTSTLMMPLLVVLFTGWLSFTVIRQAVLWPEMSLWMGFGIGEQNPVAEAKYIKRYYPTARIGNSYDEGSYLLHELWPENTVFIDARFFPFRAFYNEYFDVFHGRASADISVKIKTFMEKYPCDLWCVGYNSFSVVKWLNDSPEWKMSFFGKSAVVFVRQDISLPGLEGARYSSDLNTLRNLANVREVLLWAVMIRDWPAVEEVLARSKAYFTAPEQRKIVDKMTRYAQRMKESDSTE